MIYLDNSATSDKKPYQVKKAVMEALNNPVNIGRSTGKNAFLYSRKIYEAREEICDLIGGNEPQSVMFTLNATAALNIALKGSLKNEKPHIVTTFTEHNSVLRQIYSHNNIEVSFLPCKDDYTADTDKLPELIRDDTDLVVLNCASNVTGNMLDWQSAYNLIQSDRKNPIPVLFDFSQAAGNIPINLYGMDYCMAAFSGHKSLLGPQGTGVLYVSPKLDLNTIAEGGTGSMSTELIQPDFYPDRFESGTLNTPGIMGLYAGVKYVKKATVENLREKKMRLAMLLYDRLKNMNGIKVYHDGNFDNKIPIVSFNVRDIYSDEIASALNKKYGICVRGGYHCAPFIHKIIGTEFQGAVRASIGYKTKKREILKLCDCVYKLSKEM